MCHKAATNICITVKKYRKAFGSFNKSPMSATYCLLSAALVLIQVASSETDVGRKRAATANIDLCLQCLDELSVLWKIAESIHRNLVLLKVQKLGIQTSSDGAHTASESTPASGNEFLTNGSVTDNTLLPGCDSTDAVLLEDTHSFLESYCNNNQDLETSDFTSQLADIGMQDSCLWGTFGTDFPFSPEV